jgi:peptidoglycan/xylan/chitin deacetylase (PgdA/CDA1 family)
MRATRTRWQRFAEWTIQRSGVLSLLEHFDRLRPASAVPILMFHRIQDPATCGDRSEPDLISAPPEVFAQEMEHLARHFHPVSAADLLAALDGATLPHRAVLLTFDDGTRDFVDYARPVLERLRIPAVLCVPTGYAGNPDHMFWQDRLYQALSRTSARKVALDGLGHFDLSTSAARSLARHRLRTYIQGLPGTAPEALLDKLERQLGVHVEPLGQSLSWAELRGLGDRLSIIPHGRWHARLGGMAPAEQDAEIAGSLSDMRAHLGDCLPIFCYPYGSFDANVLASVRRAGYRAALSTRAGFASVIQAERLALRRVNIYHGTLGHFRLDLTRAFAWYLARRADMTGPTFLGSATT